MKPLFDFLHPQNKTPITLAHYTLETGRSHQIRVQSAAQGHALLGDAKYGDVESLALFSRPALHSCTLSFLHPISKERLIFDERYAFDMIASFPSLLDH